MKKNILMPLGAALVVALVLVAALMTKANSEPTITAIDGKTPNGQNAITDPISQTPTFTGEAPAGSIVSIYNQTALAGTEDIAKLAEAEPDLSIVKNGGGASFADDFSGPYSTNWLATNTDLITQNNGKLGLRAGSPQNNPMDGIYAHNGYANGNGQNFIQGTLTIPDGFQSNQGGGPNYILPIVALSNEMSAAIRDNGGNVITPGVPAIESPTFNPGFSPMAPDGSGNGISHPYLPLLAVFLQENGFLPPMQPQQYNTYMTPELQSALSAFENAAGLPVSINGLSPQTADFINNLPREGGQYTPAGGYELVILQVFLSVNGFSSTINGRYDQDTVNAMQAFQNQNGLPQTGNYDQATLQFVNSINSQGGGNNGGQQQAGLSLRFGLRTSDTQQGGLGGDLQLSWDDLGSIVYKEVINNQFSNPANGNLSFNPGTYTIRLEYGNGSITVKINGTTYATAQVGQLPASLIYTPYFAIAGNDQGLTFGFDDFSSNLSIPATYSMAATGMSYGNTSYNDPIPFAGNIPGVVLWTDQSNFVPLPLVNSSEFPLSGDIYVYLTKLTIPAGMLGNPTEIVLRWTSYAGAPQDFKNTVNFFNTQIGVPFIVEAYAKAFTRSGDIFTPSAFPITNVGQIDENGNLLPPANTSLLLARAIADGSGVWTAEFGKDETGAQIPHLDGQTLASVSPAPYSFIVYATLNGQTYISLVPITADATEDSSDTTPPVSTFEVTGTKEPAPYDAFYQDSATITLAATDEGSGVQKIVYSLSGAMEREETEYTAPIVISVAGETVITFRAIDNAGNGETPEEIVVKIDKDTDGDSVYDNLDNCTLQGGQASFGGCPFAINIRGTLRVHYSGKSSGYASIVNGKEKREARLSLIAGDIGDSRNEKIEPIQVKVFSTQTLKSAYGKTFKKVMKQQCNAIFDTAPALSTHTLTNTVTDLIGIPARADYVIAVKNTISEPDGSQLEATVCRSIAARAFRWTQVDEDTFTKTPGGQLGQGTIARPRAKFTKTIKAPKNTCTADDDQDSPDKDRDDNNNGRYHRDDDDERDVVESD